MKKLILFFSFIMVISFSLISYANTSCATKYPVVLSHGVAYSGNGIFGIGYFYNIPKALQNDGAQVFVSNQAPIASTADRAAQLKTYIQQVLVTTKATKVNLVCHSMGGLDARYMVSNLGMAPYVASITTLCTPHRGSRVADVILGLNKDMGGWISALANNVYAILFAGPTNAVAAAQWLSVKFMSSTFNPMTPDAAGIYYQSWSSTVDFPCALDKTVFAASAALLYYYDGANDGLVAKSSAKWDNYRGNQGGSIFGSGVSHVNMCDQFLDYTPFFNAPGFYVSVVQDLVARGY